MTIDTRLQDALNFRPQCRNDRIRFAISCSSNMNRSMEVHEQLKNRGFMVESFGSGSAVKLPGPALDRPNIYEFDSMSYAEIRRDLIAKNHDLYVKNGLLAMLDRNRRIKERPQKFQTYSDEFDVIICLEERVYDQIIDFFHKRPSISGNLVHIINVDIRDTHDEAVIGAFVVRDLCEKLQSAQDLDNEMDDIIVDLDAAKPERNLLHSVHFY